MTTQLFTLGRVAAIPIRLHWGLLPVGLLAVAAIQPTYAGLACASASPCGAGIAWAALAAGLVGLSVLAHELGHALAARHHAIAVEQITLFAFGGSADLDRDATSPAADLAIAVGGPIASLLIALAGGLGWWLAERHAASPPLALVAAHVGLANALVATFNLLPALPLDGGRLLRAVLWFLLDDPLDATRSAARAGQAVAAACALLGLIVAIALGQPFALVWGLAVSLFLYRAAGASHRHARLALALRGVAVGDLMRRHPRAVSADLTVEQLVARFVIGHGELGFAVVAPGAAADQLLGMVSLRDLRQLRGQRWAGCAVADLMRPASQLPAIQPATPLHEVVDLIAASPDGLLPVVEAGRLVGLLSRHDVLRFIQLRLARGGR